ncbi:uncharacterized protein LOC143367212 [Andrena cerasifolii]|uniref:uncharacterized protein LOC143367212 n=1 Tax=Andrena cerasifolii TaxID=2819439 RepID=UPI004037AD79
MSGTRRDSNHQNNDSENFIEYNDSVNDIENTKDTEEHNDKSLEDGRKLLKCLSLENIEREIPRGQGSILSIRCHKCILNGGMGWTHINKFFACLNIPCFNYNTCKVYEKEVGKAAEQVAKKSCEDAAAVERMLTIQNVTSIEKSLPENFQSDFLIPHKQITENSIRLMTLYEL